MTRRGLLKIFVSCEGFADTKAMYTLNATGEYNSILINVTPEGFLAGLGSGATNESREQEMTYSEVEDADADIDYIRFRVAFHEKRGAGFQFHGDGG